MSDDEHDPGQTESWQTQYVGDVDRSQPWQAQHAERLSRGLNRRTPWVRHQILMLALGVAALVAFTLLLFVLTKG